MAILQISKIQQRSGNLVDLPQLDDAEFGWATDAKRLFIGKTTPNENIEILTSYSQINFSQINGTVGNLNISNVTIADGQLLTYDGSEWVNRGGDAGGLITLGDVSNVKITGGAIGYVLETDGLGNLSWTPKSTILSYIENVTKATTAVVTTTQDNFFTQGAAVTISDVPGMTQLNGNQYYVSIISANSFSLYSDSGLTTPVNSTGYTAFSYSTVSATSTLTDEITVANSAVFSLNDPVVFAGDLGNSTIVVGQTYYIKTKPSSTKITISETAGGATFDPGTEASPTNARVYVPGGRALSVVSGGTSSLSAAGSNTQIQYNDTNLLQGNADFTYNNSTKLLSLNGNANVGNLNSSGVVTATQLISNIATGTEPLTVTSTTRVSNLNVSYSNVSDFEVVTNQTTGTFYPVFVNNSATGNRALGANANISFNAATGNLSVTLLSVTSNANVGNLGTAGLIAATGNVSGGNLTTGGVVSATGNVTGGNLTTAGVVAATGNVSGGNLTTGGVVSATGNVTGGNLVTAGIANIGANANVSGNLNLTNNALITGNVTASRLISNIATGTAPITVSSVTRVANLNVSYANVSDFAVVTSQSTGTYYPVFASGSSTANYALAANSGISANLANGAIIATTFVGNVSGNISGTLTAPGANTQVIFNDNGNANATSGLTFNKSTNLLTVTGNVSGGNLTTAGALSVTGNANVGNLGTGGLITATGNVTGGNLVTGGVVAATGNVSGGNLTTGGVVAATGNVSGGNLTTGGVVAATGNVTGSNLIATSYHIRSITTGITAAGSTQGTATALTREINVVSTVSVGEGVVLPTAVAGMVLIVNNTSANTLNVYPASGGAINSGSTNAAYAHSSGASIQYYATSSTQWYTVGATFA